MSAAKQNWPRVKLGEVGTVVRGNGIKRSDTRQTGKPCLRYGEIYTSYEFVLAKPKSFVSADVFDRSPHIKKGDLVFTLTGETEDEIAKTLAYLGDEEIAAGGDLAVWSNHGCDPKYLAYLMYSPELIKAKALASNGQIIVHISVKKFQQIEIPLPPLPVQREIVARLERELGAVDKLAKKFEELETAAEAEFKAELKETFEKFERFERLGEDEMVGRSVPDRRNRMITKNALRDGCGGEGTRRPTAMRHVKLGEVCEILDSMRVPITKKDRKAGPYPYYGASGIVDYVAEWLFDERLVLLGEDGAKWGAGDMSAFIIEGKTWVNNHAHVLRPSNNVYDCFLVYYLNFADLSGSITGVTVPKLNQQKMCEISIPLPPLPAQRSIVARLDTAKAKKEALVSAAKRGREAAALWRKAILKEAFA